MPSPGIPTPSPLPDTRACSHTHTHTHALTHARTLPCTHGHFHARTHARTHTHGHAHARTKLIAGHMSRHTCTQTHTPHVRPHNTRGARACQCQSRRRQRAHEAARCSCGAPSCMPTGMTCGGGSRRQYGGISTCNIQPATYGDAPARNIQLITCVLAVARHAPALQVITVEDINQENICCLNTALLFFLIAHRRGRLEYCMSSITEAELGAPQSGARLRARAARACCRLLAQAHSGGLSECGAGAVAMHRKTYNIQRSCAEGGAGRRELPCELPRASRILAQVLPPPWQGLLVPRVFESDPVFGVVSHRPRCAGSALTLRCRALPFDSSQSPRSVCGRNGKSKVERLGISRCTREGIGSWVLGCCCRHLAATSPPPGACQCAGGQR